MAFRAWGLESLICEGLPVTVSVPRQLDGLDAQVPEQPSYP